MSECRTSSERFAFAKHCGRMAIAARVIGGHASAITWWRGASVAALHSARTLQRMERRG